jgi:hypothetical protein
VWKRLSHEHVLPFYGVDTTNFQLALVYGWADSGNIVQYLDSHPKVSRTRLVSSPPFNSTAGRSLTQNRIPSYSRCLKGFSTFTLPG